jgi:hypothetical protein
LIIINGNWRESSYFCWAQCPTIRPTGSHRQPHLPSPRALSVACGKIDKCKPLIQHFRCSSTERRSPQAQPATPAFGRTRRLLLVLQPTVPFVVQIRVFTTRDYIALIRQVCESHDTHSLYQSSRGSDSISREETASSSAGQPTSQDA